MDTLRLIHLTVLLVWAGVVLSEIVLEVAARDPAARQHAARVHYWIDLTVELPLLAGVLLSGGLLAERAWPLACRSPRSPPTWGCVTSCSAVGERAGRGRR